MLVVLAALLSGPVWAEEGPAFYRGFNLGGPALVIDQHPWEAGDAEGIEISGARFENQAVRLIPATDENRTRMIRSSRWPGGGKFRATLKGVPAGTYSVYLYLWEDNDSETFDILLGGKVVAKRVISGKMGHWQRLGPWVIDASEGKIELGAEGGAANLSGLEVWRGTMKEGDHPLPVPVKARVITAPDDPVGLLLARNCLECHNPSDKKGGLDLTRREPALAGGESGQVITPGRPEDSLLWDRIADGEMPPRGRTPLTGGERDQLRAWLAGGAKWAVDPIDPFIYTSEHRAGYNWWSLQPVRPVEPPPVAKTDWPVNGIDQFIMHRLEKAGLNPSPAADQRTLIRRLTFDLTGLPPTPEEIDPFLKDTRPDAYERLVDRLLDSPHYGERWARHWLDIVRYGESQGFERNKFRPSAWKYRDFVVEAFNSDLPYDDFIRWQIAGDLLEPENPLAVIASGFLALGPYDLTAYTNGTPDMRAFAREEELEGLVATVGQTFLGLTINCARCHDHKFDPITQREFYQISAALGGTYQGDEREALGPNGSPAAKERVAELQRDIAAHQADLPSLTGELQRRELARLSRLESLLRLWQDGPVHTTVPQEPGPWPILARGDYRLPGDLVTPGGIAAVSGVPADWQISEEAPEAERRQRLAEWIANPANPLTARVIVNRLWGHHFGQGLVTTPSDFGFQGGLPSHPELLDWLAGQLVAPTDNGRPWSLKRMHRLMVLSATYRQSSRFSETAASLDAENRLLWHAPGRRLEAEAFRDTVLAVSGELNPTLGGEGYKDYTVSSAGNNETYTVFVAVGGEFNRRSLYRTSVRTGTSPLLDMLDCPDPSVATPRRSVTSTPLQALALLNDQFMEHYAGKFAERLARDAPGGVAPQVQRAYLLAFGRAPSEQEIAFGEQFIAEHGLAQFCLVLLNTNEFLYVD